METGMKIIQLAYSRKRLSAGVKDITEYDISRKNAKRISMSVLKDVSTCKVESIARQKVSEEEKVELNEQ